MSHDPTKKVEAAALNADDDVLCCQLTMTDVDMICDKYISEVSEISFLKFMISAVQVDVSKGVSTTVKAFVTVVQARYCVRGTLLYS